MQGGLVELEWENLLKPYRLGCPKDSACQNPDRSEFQRDYDRIIFSTAFRRLNGKTQVFPFPETDIIHTRLTHSLEAASVGRSLGAMIGNYINKINKGINSADIAAIVGTASLAHDIGNPPLGHSGEKAFQEFFSNERGQIILRDLNDEQKADFINFDGNAMGFHLLTYSNPKKTNITGGMSLTYPTLAAFTKYPKPAYYDDNKDKASEMKMGLFQSDLSKYSEIASELRILEKDQKLSWHRHPLAFLTEAADDICYGIMDLEDGYKHNLISYEATAQYFISICEFPSGNTDIKSLKNIIDEREQVGYLRAKAINSMVNQVINVFIENIDEIMKGIFDTPLCELTEAARIKKEISKTSIEEIYSYKPVLQVEAAGYQVLSGLLDTYLFALKEGDKNSSKKIIQLIPDEYIVPFGDKPYDSILGILRYIAGMTDTFAVDTYRNLKGIQLPNY